MLLEKIQNFLKLQNFEFINLELVDSTMNEAKKQLKNNNLCILANQQTNGVGRRGSKWISAKGNIYLSFLINYDLGYKKHFIFNAAATNTVCEVIDFFCKTETKIKWPNDILINNYKVSGIISELFKKNTQTYIVLGIGINFDSSPKINNYPTTYIKNYIKNIDKYYLIYQLTKIFFKQYEYILNDKHNDIINLYKTKLLHLGKNINIEQENNIISNIFFEDINLDGSILANINGLKKNIYSARIKNDSK
ncbi:MAG: biotin--[acetyl-CoA-carboxylase] ligase [Pelagibacteraceae bacterium]|nr:biotin--[acetyl-CoA-carboxylase] ligase [Pelagibacteraceae bacterium]|tara:strand:+ start:13926 stop:14675 length:750 start_codon:yes stop_codon:yes gene_type:complete